MALEGNYGWLSKDPEVSGSPDRLFLSSRDSIFARKYIARDERSEKVQIVRSKLLISKCLIVGESSYGLGAD